MAISVYTPVLYIMSRRFGDVIIIASEVPDYGFTLHPLTADGTQ